MRVTLWLVELKFNAYTYSLFYSFTNSLQKSKTHNCGDGSRGQLRFSPQLEGMVCTSARYIVHSKRAALLPLFIKYMISALKKIVEAMNSVDSLVSGLA